MPGSPPMPEPTITPVRQRSSSVLGSQPESVTACWAAARPKRIKSSIRRCSFGSTHWSGLKVASEPSPRGTSQAILVARSSVLNLAIRRAPLSPESRRAHVSSTPQASGVTSPNPVTTTRRMGEAVARSGLRFFDELHRVADSDDGFGGVVGDFDTEFFFERHHEFDGIEAVCTQVFNQGRALGDLVVIDIQMLDDDLLHAFRSIAHCSFETSRCWHRRSRGNPQGRTMFPRALGGEEGPLGNTIRFDLPQLG